jgi:hypothetical protein
MLWQKLTQLMVVWVSKCGFVKVSFMENAISFRHSVVCKPTNLQPVANAEVVVSVEMIVEAVVNAEVAAENVVAEKEAAKDVEEHKQTNND